MSLAHTGSVSLSPTQATRAANQKARLNGVLLSLASSLVLLALLFLLVCQVQVRRPSPDPAGRILTLSR